MAARFNSMRNMDDIPYVVEAINDVLIILERFENMNNDEQDFQLLLCKLDYLQRITVNLDQGRN